MASIENEYLFWRGSQEPSTISELFGGVFILKIGGFTSLGKPINVYTAQWVNSQTEDYMVTSKVEINNQEYDAIFRENVDLDITFIVRDKNGGATDVRETHDAFIAYMTDGALYIKSNYTERTMRAVCLKEYKPTSIVLKRPLGSNYILGTITMHTLDVRAGENDGYVPNPYQEPSEEEPTPTPPSTLVQATNVWDTALGARQSELNQIFNSKSDVQVSVQGKTLVITTQRT